MPRLAHATLLALTTLLAACGAMQPSTPSNPLPPAAVVATIPLDRPPTLLAMTPDGSRLLAASSGTFRIVATATNAVTATVRIPTYTSGIAVTPDGATALVDNVMGADLTVVDLATATTGPSVGLVMDIPPGGFGRLAVSRDGRTAWVTNGSRNYLAVANLATRDSAQSLMDMRANDAVLSPDGRTVFVAGCRDFCSTGTVESLDTSSGQITGRWDVGGSPYRVAVSPDGTRLYTANLGGPSLSIVDVASRQTLATLPVGVAPAGLAVSPDGTRVYVAAQDSATLTVVDTTANTVSRTLGLPRAPRDVVTSPDGRRVYVSTAESLLVLDAAAVR